MRSMCLVVSCYTFKNKQVQSARSPPSNFSISIPAAQQLSQSIKHHQWPAFLELPSAHKSHRQHVQILSAQLLSQNFSQLWYYLDCSLTGINLQALTSVLDCRAQSPVTLQKQAMKDQDAYNNTNLPWLQETPQQSSSWGIWQRHCSVKKTFLNLGTINSPITYAATSSLAFIYETFNTSISASLGLFIFLIISNC